MSDNIILSPRAWTEYIELQDEDKRMLKKINQLIKDIHRNGNSGIGNPEPLKHEMSGYWSREIDKKNRIIYKITEDNDIEILQIKGHYSDK